MALTIVFIMGGVMVVNYKGEERINELIMAANEVATHIRTAQSNSMGSVRYGTSTPDGGWGIHIDLNESDTSYKLFANKNYDDGDNLSYDIGESFKEKGGRTFELSPEIKIASTTVGDKVDITFLPPDPDTIIYNGTSTSTKAEIVLTNKAGETRRVKVNSFGGIEVMR